MGTGGKMNNVVDKVDGPTIVKMAGLKQDLENDINKSVKDPEYRRSQILKYIREHSGEIISFGDLAIVAGFSTKAAGSLAKRYIEDLIREGRITKKHHSKRIIEYKYINPEDIGKESPQIDIPKTLNLEIVSANLPILECIKQWKSQDSTQLGIKVKALLDFEEYYINNMGEVK